MVVLQELLCAPVKKKLHCRLTKSEHLDDECGELAKAVGIKNGQRYIGNVMNKNPYPVIIPCHRVVMSTGKIGGYAYGDHIKAKMLHDEGIEIKNGKIVDLEKKLYKF